MKIISLFVSFFLLIGFSFNILAGDVPDWVKGKLPSEPNSIYAAGLANIGPNLVMARKKADDDARNEIAKILSVKVKSVFEKFTKESIDLLNPDVNSSTEISSEVTKSVTEATILNVSIVERYEDEENKIMHSLAVMKKDQIVTQIKEVVNEDKNKIFKEDKKIAALKILDDELEKWDLNQ